MREELASKRGARPDAGDDNTGECTIASAPGLFQAERLVAAAIVTTIIAAVVVAGVTLILCAADHISSERAEPGTDRGTFETSTALVADDPAGSCAAKRANGSARASVRPARAGCECE